MYFLTLFIAILMANIVKSSAIHALQNEPILECAEEAPSPDFLQFSKLLQSSNSSLTRRQTREDFNFNVFAHVVYYDKTAQGGYVEEEDIKNAIEAMNWNFDGSGISFTLINVSYTENQDWATLRDVAAMKNELREGTYADLNLYYVSTIAEDADRGTTTSGTCTLPVTFHVNGKPVDITTRNSAIVSEKNLVRDGCIIVARSVNRHTATHEVGHWLGLLHTFEGDCSDDGDMIDDTAPQEKPTWRCSAVRERFSDGTPAHYACGGWRESNMYNFMDYSDCTSTFTEGQKKRMGYWAEYREILGARGPTHHASRPAAPAPAPVPAPPSDEDEGNTQRLSWFKPNIFEQEGGNDLCTGLADFKLSGSNSLSADLVDRACGTELFCKIIEWDWQEVGPQALRDRLGFASYDECIAGHEAEPPAKV